MDICHECCVLTGRGLYNELITHPAESYRLWCIIECDLETSGMRGPWPTGGCCAKLKKKPPIWQQCPHIQWVLGAPFNRVKQMGCGDVRSPPSNAEVKNEWNVIEHTVNC